MDLIFFDLDGTLLNKSSEISPFTKETLMLLSDTGIAHTVATGRTMLSAQRIIGGYNFSLPHIYSNGVTVWDPNSRTMTLENILEWNEVSTILSHAHAENITPFVHSVEEQNDREVHVIYHSTPKYAIENDLLENYYAQTDAMLLPLSSLPTQARITNVSMIGDEKITHKIWEQLNKQKSLIAYCGPAIEGNGNSWLDVHHRLANKGSAVQNLKIQLGASNVICFGDGDNDLSMFELADESYAMNNAKDIVKQSATDVIGHHHEDGVAHFLRERFSL